MLWVVHNDYLDITKTVSKAKLSLNKTSLSIEIDEVAYFVVLYSCRLYGCLPGVAVYLNNNPPEEDQLRFELLMKTN